MAHDRVYSALEPIVTARFNELCAHGQVPTFSANAEGLPVLNSWTTPAYFGVVYRDLLADLPMYGLRIQTFAANKAQAMAQSMRAKREVVAAADVEMADTAPTGVAGPGPSTIQSMVDKAVAARMKKLEKPEGKGKGKGKGKDNGKKKTSSSSSNAKRPPEVKHPKSSNSKSGPKRGNATGSKKGKGKGKRGGKK
ncbi:hypothetical protein IEO21_06377 [Rhodonia placenta]|uniref:Uncharacterized protein n=1 Tax=Rhodonia placenta TaxID=104341 RepID=A0A8H7P0G3_9APHY|nr:hypothetical protein IEO21_06377 [Postia placenta]